MNTLETQRQKYRRPVSRAAIPTEYKGINFRSLLEVKWARFFDHMKLTWDFEPETLDFYIPDFILHFPIKPLIVEIKPTSEHFDYAKQKLDQSGYHGDAVIVVSGKTNDIGWFREEMVWDRAVLGQCLKCKAYTIASEGGRWDCRSCGADSSQIWWTYNPEQDWAQATNESQWRPGK